MAETRTDRPAPPSERRVHRIDSTPDDDFKRETRIAHKKVHFDDKVLVPLLRQAGLPDEEMHRVLIDAVYQKPKGQYGRYGRTVPYFGDDTPGNESTYHMYVNFTHEQVQGDNLWPLERQLRRSVRQVGSYHRLGLFRSPQAAEHYLTTRDKRMMRGMGFPTAAVALNGVMSVITGQAGALTGIEGRGANTFIAGATLVGMVACFRTTQYILESHDPAIPHARTALEEGYKPIIKVVDLGKPAVPPSAR